MEILYQKSFCSLLSKIIAIIDLTEQHDFNRQGRIQNGSSDLTDEARHLLKRGEIDFTIAQDIYLQEYHPLLLREYIQQGGRITGLSASVHTLSSLSS